MPKNRVFVNNFESICCAGSNSEEIFEAICNQITGISIVKKEIDGRAVAIGKIGFEYKIDELLRAVCSDILAKSNLDDFSSTLLVVGSSVGGMSQSESIFLKDKNYKNINPKLHIIDSIAYRLKKMFDFKDDFSFSTACTSGANAIGFGYEVIKKGLYKNVLVVGFDTLSHTTVCGFDSLGVLSSQPCKPFDSKRDGMNVAEGLGVLLLQDEPSARCVEVLGVGYSSDAYHMTKPSPDGVGAKTAMSQALGEIEAKDVDYINAHGTGTLANDSSEALAILSIFGSSPFVSSTKSITGHTLGASGVIEAIVCVEAILKSTIPPNTNLVEKENLELNLPTKVVKKSIQYALSNSLAFGGNNTSVLFGRV